MHKHFPRLIGLGVAAAIGVATPAFGFRGGGFGGFGGFHGGGFGGFHGGGFRGGADVMRGPAGGVAAVGRGPAGGVYGAARGPYGGWHAGGVGAYGGTWHADGYHAGGYYADGFHGPAVVNGYYTGGCYACSAGWGGVAAGTAVGLAAGAAIGAAARYDIGTTLASLPPGGCSEQIVGTVSYYQCGPTWLRGYYGNNGLYYRVVAAP